MKTWLLVPLALAGLSGPGALGAAPAADAWLLTQVPPSANRVASPDATVLDGRYPDGSRVIRVRGPGNGSEIRVLSEGLTSAGGAAVSPDGQWALFAGKAGRDGSWQVYRTSLTRGGSPERVTDLPGGAGEPAWLPGGRFVCTSPVPPLAPAERPEAGGRQPTLYGLSATGGVARRLTFGVTAATEPTVLGDGRILFVSSVPGAPPGSALFTVNNDGTEVSALAGQHDGAMARPLRRPRETPDGLLLFLSLEQDAAFGDGCLEMLRLARPSSSRCRFSPTDGERARSVEVLPDATWLAALAPVRETAGHRTTYAIHRLSPGPSGGREVVFDAPDWDDVEAVPVAGRSRFMGRLSNVDEGRTTGLMLCLDVRRSDRDGPKGVAAPGECRVRVTGHRPGGEEVELGDAGVREDGSFLVEVPADLALGFELRSGDGRVIERCPPASWVRPGENRTCIGCHEPHGRAAENRRPLAVDRPATPLSGATAGATPGKGAP